MDEILWKGRPSFVLVLKRTSYFGLTLALIFYALRKILEISIQNIRLPTEVSYIMEYIKMFDIVLMIGIGIGLLLFISSIVFSIIRKFTAEYIITENGIKIENNIIVPSFYDDVKIERSFLDHAFGTGDIIVGKYKMESVSNPEAVYEIIQKISKRPSE